MGRNRRVTKSKSIQVVRSRKPVILPVFLILSPSESAANRMNRKSLILAKHVLVHEHGDIQCSSPPPMDSPVSRVSLFCVNSSELEFDRVNRIARMPLDALRSGSVCSSVRDCCGGKSGAPSRLCVLHIPRVLPDKARLRRAERKRKLLSRLCRGRFGSCK
ncbi:hypothetical protein CCACVL1_03225 [Corchorus capsularis]|uniref:Uncharacterized protein n=1 Tax=Corchorus capsularis TaxID=210143 RepID=A0A1R3K1H3_COCAP|nr:hypothetical protein CCACVL1_03225 [Corchorus capsularis]